MSASTPAAPSPADPFPARDDLLPAVLPLLGPWMRARRWYGSQAAGAVDVTALGSALLAQTPGHQVLALVVRVRRGEGGKARTTDYQVPLLVRPADPGTEGDQEPGTRIDEDPAAVIGRVPGPHGELEVIDATCADAGRSALLELVVGSRAVTGPGLELTGSAVPFRGTGRILSSRILSGEQSNSSMIVEREEGAPLIAKLFRVLQEGENPDVVLQGALDAAGSEQVAPLIGSAAITWGTGEDHRRGHALFAQEFFPGVQDAWRVALTDARAGTDFTRGARELGEATAQVHLDLAARMPTAPASAAERRRMIDSMLARLQEARAEVPAVDAAADRLAAVIGSAADADWPDFQRVHGDYHLGQVLAVPDRGWVLLDFEGEPMRPLSERELPDCPVRDVAGMLRSLDYVGGAVHLDRDAEAAGADDADVDAWVDAARQAFLAGYGERSGIDVTAHSYARLLAAFEADKAVYEALYEARNRPDWLPIPLGALSRIAG